MAHTNQRKRIPPHLYLGGIGKAAKLRRYTARQARRYSVHARQGATLVVSLPHLSPNVPPATA